MRVAVVLALALPCVGATTVQRDGQMNLAETRHYRVKCDIGPEVAREIAETMEAVGGAYYRILKRFRGGRFGRLDVVVFRNRADYVKVVGAAHADTAGVYMGGTRTTYACTGGGDISTIIDVLRHEGFHQFAHHFLGASLPAWINEGLAEYFHYSRFDGRDFVTGEVGLGPLMELQAAIRAGKTVPLGEFITWTTAEWNTVRMADPARGALAYHQAYLFTYFLMEAEGRKHRRLVGRFLGLLNKGRDGTKAFHEVFGRDTTSIQEKWEAVVLALQASSRQACRARMKEAARLLVTHGGGKQLTAHGLLELISKNDPRGPRYAEAVLHCPNDADDVSHPSYRIRYAKDGADRLEIVCTHHKGYIIILRLRKDEAAGIWQSVFLEPSVK